MFTAVDKKGLEASILKTKALTMIIELVSQFLSGRWYGILKDNMNEQIVFDLFNHNFTIFQNFIVATELQQRIVKEGDRLLKNE